MFSIDKEFEVENGMLGMKRDVVLRICKLFWNNAVMIREVFGMDGQEQYQWKNHVSFLRNRPCKVPVSFLPEDVEIFNITPVKNGKRCSFKNDKSNIFLDKEISEGIYRWTIRIKYKSDPSKDSKFYIGINCTGNIYYYSYSPLSTFGGSCAFCFEKIILRKYHWITGTSYDSALCGLQGVYSSLKISTHVRDYSIVSVEVDLCTEVPTMYFFVDGERVPHAVTRVRTPFYFGVTGSAGQSIISTSLLRLRQRTPSSAPCECHSWENSADDEPDYDDRIMGDRKSVV